MKIMMPVKNNKGWETELNPRFGRSPYFALVNLDNDDLDFISNTASNAGSGAGVKAAQMIADYNPEVLIAPNIGPKAYAGINKLDLKIYLYNGTIEETVKAYHNGQLEEMEGPTNNAHAGLK